MATSDDWPTLAEFSDLLFKYPRCEKTPEHHQDTEEDPIINVSHDMLQHVEFPGRQDYSDTLYILTDSTAVLIGLQID